MKNKYGFCKGLAALVLLMLCALTIKDNAYAQTARSYKVLFIGTSAKIQSFLVSAKYF